MAQRRRDREGYLYWLLWKHWTRLFTCVLYHLISAPDFFRFSFFFSDPLPGKDLKITTCGWSCWCFMTSFQDSWLLHWRETEPISGFRSKVEQEGCSIWINQRQIICKRTQESRGTDVWKAQQTTHWLPETLACDRQRKKESCSTLPGILFRFCQKTELTPMEYPCVGWLLLLRRRYTHRCLQIWLPPAASDWIQSSDSAPQNHNKETKWRRAHRPF